MRYRFKGVIDYDNGTLFIDTVRDSEVKLGEGDTVRLGPLVLSLSSVIYNLNGEEHSCSVSIGGTFGSGLFDPSAAADMGRFVGEDPCEKLREQCGL